MNLAFGRTGRTETLGVRALASQLERVRAPWVFIAEQDDIH